MTLSLTKAFLVEHVAQMLAEGGFVEPDRAMDAAIVALKATTEHLDYEIDIAMIQDAIQRIEMERS